MSGWWVLSVAKVFGRYWQPVVTLLVMTNKGKASSVLKYLEAFMQVV